MTYPTEELDENRDCGVMPENVVTLEEAVVGHRIVGAKKEMIPSPHPWRNAKEGLVLTLDNGKKVILKDTSDCCAYTFLDSFLLHADKIDHVITGVGTTNEYQTWHIYADFGDIMEIEVAWSAGNPFYYGYGFDIEVIDMEEEND